MDILFKKKNTLNVLLHIVFQLTLNVLLHIYFKIIEEISTADTVTLGYDSNNGQHLNHEI